MGDPDTAPVHINSCTLFLQSTYKNLSCGRERTPTGASGRFCLKSGGYASGKLGLDTAIPLPSSVPIKIITFPRAPIKVAVVLGGNASIGGEIGISSLSNHSIF